MKISELLEAKVEMCPEACCGKPVTECKCGPDCKHCDCHAKNKMNEATNAGSTAKGAAILARIDMALDGSGLKRQGFELVKDTNSFTRGSITREAEANIRNSLAKAKTLLGGVEPEDPKPIMSKAEWAKQEFGETTSAGSVASSMGSGNGFVNGGIGTVKRNNPKKKKRSNKS